MKKKNTGLLAIIFAAITVQGAQGALLDDKKIEIQLSHLNEAKSDDDVKKISEVISNELKGYSEVLVKLSKEIDEEKNKKKKVSLKKEKIKEVRETNAILIKNRKQLNTDLKEFKAHLKKETSEKGKKNLEHAISVLEGIKKQLNESLQVGHEFTSNPQGFVKSLGHRTLS